jgi:hypothetical protein
MTISGARLRAVIFVLLAGVLAVVIIAVLLLFGVNPRLVFTPGFIVLSWCKRLGFHAPNAVGVLTTVLFLWGIIVAVRFAVTRLLRRRAA